MDKKIPLSLYESLGETYREFITLILVYSPKVFSVVALLVIGLLISHAFRIVILKVLKSIDNASQFTSIAGIKFTKSKISTYAEIFSKFVFWVILIFFITSSANLLGLKIFQEWLDGILSYIPNLAVCMVIIGFGILLANGTKIAISHTYESGSHGAQIISKASQAIIIFISFIIGVEQLGIKLAFLTNILEIGFGAMCASIALAFGLGAKSLIENVIGSQYIKRHCKIGEIIDVAGYSGVIIDITSSTIVLDSKSGRVVLPAKLFFQEGSVFSELDLKANRKSNAKK